jgi:ABC-2 type transport system permease protein
MGRNFAAKDMPGGENYLRFFFPGTIVMILLFTAIFSTISIIEDRREGFLQGVLVAPVSRMAIVLGKVLGGTILAFAQGVIFLALAPTVGIWPTPSAVGLTMLAMVIVSFALTALGFCIAWRMSSTQGFHAIMNLFLMPMWFLSGALFPARDSGLRWVMACNPLSYGMTAVRSGMYFDAAQRGPYLVGLLVSVAFAAVMFVLASVIATSRVSADLQ